MTTKFTGVDELLSSYFSSFFFTSLIYSGRMVVERENKKKNYVEWGGINKAEISNAGKYCFCKR